MAKKFPNGYSYNIQNGRKVFQMAVKYSSILPTFQGRLRHTQIRIFGILGNPVQELEKTFTRFIIISSVHLFTLQYRG
jgi:hypothetical protein